MSPELEVELKRSAPAPGAMAIPSLSRRGWNAALEIALYCFITMLVAIVEFYAGGFPGPSNWLIGLVIYALWSLNAFRRSTTPSAAFVQLAVVDESNVAASFGRMVLRTVARGTVLYALPILVFANNQIVWIAMFAAAAASVAFMERGRAPWDLIAGTTMVESYGSEATESTGPLRLSDLRVDGLRQRQNQRAARMLQFAGWGAIIVSLLIVWVVASEAFTFITDDDFSWSLLNVEGDRRGWFPRRNFYDIPTLLVGTLWVTGIAMVIAGPVGLGAAIYLSEYAKPKVRRIVKPVIETLASVPSVVIGMFAIFFISPSVLTLFFDDIGSFSVLAAGIGVGILTIPLVASISEDALRAVPMELRQAAYGLGSRKITVALRVVFPAALSGISAAFIVGISRAIGETMVVAIAAGGSGGTLFELNPTEDGQTITAAMASLGAGTDQVAGSGIAFQSLYFLGAMLFLITLILNVFSDAIVRRFREAY